MESRFRLYRATSTYGQIIDFKELKTENGSPEAAVELLGAEAGGPHLRLTAPLTQDSAFAHSAGPRVGRSVAWPLCRLRRFRFAVRHRRVPRHSGFQACAQSM